VSQPSLGRRDRGSLRMSVFIPVHDAWPHLERGARAIVLQTLPAGVVDLLAPGLRPVARVLIDGDEDAIRRQPQAVARWKTRVELLDLHAYGRATR
jgi:hypothetical protein